MAVYQKPALGRPLPHLQAALAESSWQKLHKYHPVVAIALEQEIASGATSEDVRLFVMRVTNNSEFARWIEQAAVYLRSGLEVQ